MEPGVCHVPFLELLCPRQPAWDTHFLQDPNDALESTSDDARLTPKGMDPGPGGIFLEICHLVRS